MPKGHDSSLYLLYRLTDEQTDGNTNRRTEQKEHYFFSFCHCGIKKSIYLTHAVIYISKNSTKTVCLPDLAKASRQIKGLILSLASTQMVASMIDLKKQQQQKFS